VTALLGIGGFLLSYWWIAIIVAGLGAVAGFLTMGRAFFEVLKGVVDFFKSPVGQLIAFAVVIWLAASYGAQQAEAACDAKALRAQILAMEARHQESLRQLKANNDIQREDAVRAALNAVDEQRNQEAIDATPKGTADNPDPACLKRDRARRVRDVR
jgi:hypothetical protein